MKSYSKFITENKKGTAVASPAPGGDPLDPKGRRRIEKKFSNPSNPPKVANPEASKPTPKPEGVKQADVSKKAATYRRAQRVKGATGGKTTGSLSRGTLSFPGDRSGATARVKADIEARKGFSDTKSGGLKADETSKFVNRSVRQQRTVKQGTPDPFTSKTPAPKDPFKGVIKSGPVKSSIPDPFKSATTKPKTLPKPKAPSGPGPATSQAIKDIRQSMVRQGIKTTEADVAQRYMRKMQDTGRTVDPDLVGAQGVKASGAKPEMVGGTTAPKGSYAKFRAQTDATRDISKARGADLDKALKNLVTSGDVKSSKPSGPSSPIGFKKFSTKASAITKTYKDAERNFGKPAKVDIKTPKPVVKTPKVQTPADIAFNAKKAFKTTEYTNYAVTGKGPAGELLDKAARKRYKDLARTPFGIEKASKNPPALPGSGQTGTGPRVKGSSSSIVPRKSSAPKKFALPKPKPELASKVKDALPGFKETRSGAQTLKPASKLSKLKGFARGAGRVAGPALAVVGAGLDYADDRAKGYNRTSSALRTGAKALGGAAGGALGSFLGPLGTAAGYAAGHWLTSKVLDKFHKPSKPKTPKQPTAKQRVKDAASSIPRVMTGTPAPKPAAKKEPEKDPLAYTKVNR